MTSRRPLVNNAGVFAEMPQGDVIPVACGGTGATTAEGARENLGISWSPASFRNLLINSIFQVNNGNAGVPYISGAALAAGQTGHECWKAGGSGGDYSFIQTIGITPVTIAAGKSLIQPIEDRNVEGGNYVLSWEGTAQARVGINSATPSGTYAASPILVTGQAARVTISVEFSSGTLARPQLEPGSVATQHEFRQDELLRTQRYWESSYSAGVAVGAASSLGACRTLSVSTGVGAAAISVRFSVPKRAVPTFNSYSPINGAINQIADSLTTNRNASFFNIGTTGAVIANAVTTTALATHEAHWVASSRL